ncbi:MAG: hypothetical protein ACRYFX_29470 [Janthinobacterium lividum]
MNTRFFRLLGLAAALPLALSACHTGTEAGDTNVEHDSAKARDTNHPGNVTSGDSMAAGMKRDTAGHPSGKKVFEASGQATDANHDGVAD